MSGFLSASYRTPALGGELVVTPSISYRSDYHLFDLPDPVLDQDAYTLLDVGAVWTSPSGQYEVGVFGRNLTDETYRVGGYSFPGATYNNSISAFYGPPRTWSTQLPARY